MADDWALEMAREVVKNWMSCPAIPLEDQIAKVIDAELRKERERFRCAEDQTDFMCAEADDWEARAKAAEKRAAALEAGSPIAWRYKVLVNKHVTGGPRPGEISMPDVYRQSVWGKPGAWQYSDGPDKPSADWMCEAEPLYAGAPADDRDKQIIEALKALLVETCEHLEALVKVTRDGMREPAKERK